MEIQGKYIKDEEGNIISPVTSASTVYDSNNMDLQTLLIPPVIAINFKKTIYR